MELLQSCTMPSICFLLILGNPCHLFTHVVQGYFIGTIEFKWIFNQQVEYIGTWAIDEKAYPNMEYNVIVLKCG